MTSRYPSQNCQEKIHAIKSSLLHPTTNQHIQIIQQILKLSSSQKYHLWENLTASSSFNDLMLIQYVVSKGLKEMRSRNNVNLYLADEIVLCVFKFCDIQTLATASTVCQRWHSLLKDNLLWKHLHQKHHGPTFDCVLPDPVYLQQLFQYGHLSSPLSPSSSTDMSDSSPLGSTSLLSPSASVPSPVRTAPSIADSSSSNNYHHPSETSSPICIPNYYHFYYYYRSNPASSFSAKNFALYRRRKLKALTSPKPLSISPPSSLSPTSPHSNHRHHQEVVQNSSLTSHNSHPWIISPISPPMVCSEWKKIYRQYVGTKMNWKKGQYSVKKLDTGTLCVEFDDQHVASLNMDDGKLWDIQNGSCLIRFTGHRSAITTVKFDDLYVVTASRDTTIKIWEKMSGQCIKTLIGHEEEVGVVEFDALTYLVSGAEDGTIRLWDFSSGECSQILNGHSDGITCLQFDDEYIVSGSADMSMRIWKIQDGELLKIIPVPQGHIYTLQFDKEFIITGDDASHIRIWDFKTGKLNKVLSGHHQSVLCLQFDQDKIVSGSADRTIKVWDRSTGFCMYTLRAHKDMIWNLRFTSNKLITSSIDQTLAVWDFSHNEKEEDDDNEDDRMRLNID